MLAYRYYSKKVELLAYAVSLDDGADDFTEFAKAQLLDDINQAEEAGIISKDQSVKLLMKIKVAIW